MKKEFVRNPYNYDSDQVSEDTGLKCQDETLTEQQWIEEADINYIADRFMRTGEAPQILNLPTAGDFEGIFDFQTAMNTLAQAREEFASLPAKTRSRFENDPAKLLDFVNNKDNYDEAVKLGFISQQAQEQRDASRRETEANRDKEIAERIERIAAAKKPNEGNEKPRSSPNKED